MQTELRLVVSIRYGMVRPNPEMASVGKQASEKTSALPLLFYLMPYFEYDLPIPII